MKIKIPKSIPRSISAFLLPNFRSSQFKNKRIKSRQKQKEELRKSDNNLL